jgi:hypothetical protein
MRTTPHTDLSQWLIEFSHEFKDPIVKNAPENVRGFFACDLSFPDEYGYRFHDANAFAAHSKKILETEGEKAFEKCYWMDFIRNMAAYSIVTKWRFTEITDEAVSCLNNRNYVAAAILARSGLELSASFVDNSRYLSHNLERVAEEMSASQSTAVLSEDLEKFSLRVMWGTRLGQPPDELVQKNVLGVINRLSKNEHAKDLIRVYEFLCEAAHPNVIGNQCYFDGIRESNPDGSQSWLLNRYAFSAGSKALVEKTLWAISWGCVATQNAYEGFDDDLNEFLKKLSNAQRKA